MQIRLSKLNSTSNAPVAPRQLSCPISANQREAETSANVKKKKKKKKTYRKTRAKGNDVIANVISANQHFASTFSYIFHIPETQFKAILPFPAPSTERPGEPFRKLSWYWIPVFVSRLLLNENILL